LAGDSKSKEISTSTPTASIAIGSRPLKKMKEENKSEKDHPWNSGGENLGTNIVVELHGNPL
jgi:hypothetical protein